MQTIDGMLTLGTEEAVIREATPGRTFYDTAFTLNLLRGASVTVLVAALAYPAADFFADPRLGPVLLFVACLPLLDGFSNIGAVDFRRDFAFHKEFAIMVLAEIVRHRRGDDRGGSAALLRRDADRDGRQPDPARVS